ncbi:MAG: universal stress protein [Bacillota bacterium]
MFRKILFPTDGSNGALNTARYLVKLQREIPDLRITMLNVYQILPDISGETFMAPGLEESVKMMSERALETTLRVFEEAGVDVTPVSREGEPVKEILAMAEEGHYDHIVMGSKGSGTFRGMVFGSVAQRVLQLADIPVVIVK